MKMTTKILLCLMVTNCSEKHSFLQLKRTNNELPMTMLQERLSGLSILRKESDNLQKLDDDDIIFDYVISVTKIPEETIIIKASPTLNTVITYFISGLHKTDNNNQKSD